MRTTLALMVCGSLALVACGDDSETSSSTGGGSGGGGTTSSTSGTPGTTSSSSSSSSASSTTSTASGDQGGGGNGTGGDGGNGTGGDGGNGTGGDGGNGTGGDGGNGTGGEGGSAELAVCTDVALVSVAGDDDECELEGDLAVSTAGTALCIDPFAGPPAPLVFYEITVEAGDCIGVTADNVGSLGADIWAMVVDPDGNNVVFDDVIPCTVGDVFCPEGALTMGSAGVAYVGVGAYTDAADGCPEGERGAYQVSVNVNGTDLSLDDADVCEGDLFEL